MTGSIVSKTETTTRETRDLDSLKTPYAQARLDIAFTRRGVLVGFVGYRCEFPPVDKIGTYFGQPTSMRHTIFAGLEARWKP